MADDIRPPAPAPYLVLPPFLLYLRFIDPGSASSHHLTHHPGTSQPSVPICGNRKKERIERKGPRIRRLKRKYFFLSLPFPLPCSIPHLTSPARRRQEPQSSRAGVLSLFPSLCKLSSIHHQCPSLLLAAPLLSVLLRFPFPSSFLFLFAQQTLTAQSEFLLAFAFAPLLPRFRVTASPPPPVGSRVATPRGDGE